MFEQLASIILTASSLGVTAFGIVETLKWTRVGQFGFDEMRKHLGQLITALETTHSTNLEQVLRSLYRGEHSELAKTLRQGIRAGLTTQNAATLARTLNTINEDALTAVATALTTGTELSAEQRNVLGRFELAADASIDAALMSAQNHYAGKTRLLAGVVAIAIGLVVGLVQSDSPLDLFTVGQALLVGVLAIPVAPIAKDLVTTLQALSATFRTKS